MSHKGSLDKMDRTVVIGQKLLLLVYFNASIRLVNTVVVELVEISYILSVHSPLTGVDQKVDCVYLFIGLIKTAVCCSYVFMLSFSFAFQHLVLFFSYLTCFHFLPIDLQKLLRDLLQRLYGTAS